MRTSPWSRREFLGRSLAGALGGFGAWPALGHRARAVLNSRPSADRPILTRPLGKTGIVLPVVNMGVMNADIPMLVQRAYESGLRLFDTAAAYQRGRNEEMVGSVLQDMGVRDKAVIATKIFLPPELRSMPAERVKTFFLKTAEQSLKRLRTDRLDILYFHNVAAAEDLRNPGVADALRDLKKQGRALQIGFSTHANMVDCVEAAAPLGFYDVILTTFNYSHHDDQPLLAALAKARTAGIGLVAMKTQCNSVDWYMPQVRPELQDFYRGPILHGALLKWALRHEFITAAVPGFTTFAQLEEDSVCARGLEFTPAETKFLEDRGVKLALETACRQCGSCVATCPQTVAVPELMRARMYAVGYGRLDRARDTLDAMPGERGLNACRGCSACVARCRRDVPIGRRIEDLKSIFLG